MPPLVRLAATLSTLFLALQGVPLAATGADLPEPLFYLPFDGQTKAIGVDDAYPRHLVHEETIFTLLDWQRPRFFPGKVGQSYEITDTPLVYQAKDHFRPDEGSCAFWIQLRFSGNDTNRYCGFFGVGRWGMLYKYERHASLSFGTARPDRADVYYDCGGGSIADWQPGQWHHVALTWSRRAGARQVFVDGKPRSKGRFDSAPDTADAPLYIGGGCDLYPGKTAWSRIDELAIWGEALSPDMIASVYRQGQMGKVLFACKERRRLIGPGEVAADLQTLPHFRGRPAQLTSTRQRLSLDGRWAFRPADQPLWDPQDAAKEVQSSSIVHLPGQGWGTAPVPGYWTARDDLRRPDGRAANGTWNKRPLRDYAIGYYACSFQADVADRTAYLHVGGVDGLAELFLNGHLLGRLPAWEEEDYSVGSLLRPKGENLLVIAVHGRGEPRVGGIYGNVCLELAPAAFVRDVAITTSVEKSEIRLSCDVFRGGPKDGRLEFEVRPIDRGQERPRVFRAPLAAYAPGKATLGHILPVQRQEASFPWPDARKWTYDDPAMYEVVVRLFSGDAVVDQSPPVRFGFREFQAHDGGFWLNGKPTHLRGHQIDLGWGNQMPWVRDLRTAGMNAFEFSGPVSHSWYTGSPYRMQPFEEILDFADRQGLIAVPILPDAQKLREQIFDPAVASHYRRRLEKHLRRFGNHPSIAMWYMHFNLAGYRWYVAPSKVDGSYKPSTPIFKAKERYALEAERIAAALDPRPVYHHACGNFGRIFSNNCYLGPSCPLQEREEWPLRWAEKRPFPLLACEHCMMLVPYWYRPRQFPLSVVYAGEPLCDEISAMYLGPSVYGQVTPRLFDLYDLDRTPRSSRLHDLVHEHGGYQQVKSLFAKQSLRAWRTFGVSGVFFNAIRWDFHNDQGQDLPVLKALGRYFDHTDLYLAGPPGDWPAKDHAYYSGQTVHKQAVLLNDLTRDLPCTIEWRLEDIAGKPYAGGQIATVAKAGQVGMHAIEFVAPPVDRRSEFVLRLKPADPAGQKHFLPDDFNIEVFPQTATTVLPSRRLLFDPIGNTKALFEKGGITFEPLAPHSDLQAADVLVVGQRSYGPDFLELAKKVRLGDAIRAGLNLLVFEQTTPEVLGLKLTERSSRHVFISQSAHPVVNGLQPADFLNLRGRSNLVEPYPEAAPETENAWPRRFHKWGNRGITATYVYRKPHFAPLRPILECGFDLVDSPLLEGRLGRGRILFCQIDVTPRCGIDPVSTHLVRQSLSWLARRGASEPAALLPLGESAKTVAKRLGLRAGSTEEGLGRLTLVGKEPLDPSSLARLRAQVREGATAILLPGAPVAATLGLATEPKRLYAAEIAAHPLFVGLSPSDLYLKKMVDVQAATLAGNWQLIAKPGVLATKPDGKGQWIACLLDPAACSDTRAEVKSWRLWNLLLANLQADHACWNADLTPAKDFYLANPWEEMPPYMNW